MSTKLQREIDQIALICRSVNLNVVFTQKTFSFVDISQRLFSQLSSTQNEKYISSYKNRS